MLVESWKTFSSILEDAGHSLVPIQSNLVDLVWDADRPLPPQAEVKVHSLHFTGGSNVIRPRLHSIEGAV